jgi:hypothetical protein
MRGRLCAAVAAGAIMLVCAPSAIAAVTIGQANGTGSSCPAGVTIVQRSVAAGGPSYAVPSPGGVITSWSYGAGPTADQVKFKALRPIGGNDFTVIGASGTQTMTPGGVNTFGIQVRVQAGDTIGLTTVSPDTTCAQTDVPLTTADVAGGCLMCDPPPGATFSAPPLEDQSRVNVSAQVEPDCDADGHGDETQDPELPLGEACGKGNRTLTLDANKDKVKKGKKVLLSGQVTATASQGACAAAQTVELLRKRPSQTAFTAFATVQTDAQGSFSLKKKVKKTFEYRAQVLETAACGAALSNSEKVKVRKKKEKP